MASPQMPKSSTTSKTRAKRLATLLLQKVDTNERVTPMRQITDLANFNKIQHHYRLIDEIEPPKKDVFTVQLTLGDEEYKASDVSIKMVQHVVAKMALDNTSYMHPPCKMDI